MSTTIDPKLEKLIAAMKKVPEQLAEKWIAASETNAKHTAELEQSLEAKEKEFKDVVKKLADREQELSDLKASTEKIITEKTSEIKKLTEEIKNLKETPITTSGVNDNFINIVIKFISDITEIMNTNGNKKSSTTVISEVKPEKNTDKKVVTDSVPKTEKKKAEPKKEETDDESVDSVLADLGITDL